MSPVNSILVSCFCFSNSTPTHVLYSLSNDTSPSTYSFDIHHMSSLRVPPSIVYVFISTRIFPSLNNFLKLVLELTLIPLLDFNSLAFNLDFMPNNSQVLPLSNNLSMFIKWPLDMRLVLGSPNCMFLQYIGYIFFQNHDLIRKHYMFLSVLNKCYLR